MKGLTGRTEQDKEYKNSELSAKDQSKVRKEVAWAVFKKRLLPKQ